MLYWSLDKKIAENALLDISIELQTNAKLIKDFGQLFFDESNPPFGRKLITKVLLKYKEPIYTVFYKSKIDAWQIVAIDKDDSTFKVRKLFPEAWRGKRDEELAKASGIIDSYFCHNAGFICMVKSRENALLLAKKALEA